MYPNMYNIPQPYGVPGRPRYNRGAMPRWMDGAQMTQTTQQTPRYQVGFNDFNDPTLQVGGGDTDTGGPVSYTPPEGVITPPIQAAPGGLPPNLRQRGYRSMRGPDGKWYWYPPGVGPQETPRYNILY